MRKIIIEKHILEKMYVEDNLGIIEISSQLGYSRNLIARQLKHYGLKKEGGAALTKEVLTDLYVTQKLTSRQIAKQYNISWVSVCQILQKYKIEAIPKRRSFESNKDYIFSDIQRDLILGSLMGDGSVAINDSEQSARFGLGHCIAQKDYLMWKRSFLLDISPEPHYHNGKHPSLSFHTKSLPAFLEFRRMFYREDGVKIVTRQILDMIGPFALAIWIMDDGCSNDGRDYRLSTNCFTYDEQIIMRDWFLDKFFVSPKIRSRTYKENGKTYYFLCFSRADSRTLSKIIEPYVVVDCMKYKLIKDKIINKVFP